MRKPAKQLPARLQHQKSLQAKAAWASASEILACLRMISCCSMIDRGNQSSAIWSTLVPPKPAMHLLLHSPLSSSYNQAHVNMRWYLIYRAKSLPESQELSHIFKNSPLSNLLCNQSRCHLINLCIIIIIQMSDPLINVPIVPSWHQQSTNTEKAEHATFTESITA